MGQGAGEGGGSSPPRPEAVVRGQRELAPPLTQGAAWGPGSGLLRDVLVDPVQVGGDAGVDAGIVGVCAAIAPADHTCLQPGAVHLADQGPSRVTLQGGVGGSVWLQSQAVGAAGSLTHLAGVPPAVPSTQVILLHDGYAVVRGQARVVLPVTDTVLHDGHLHLLQGVWGRQGPWGRGRREAVSGGSTQWGPWSPEETPEPGAWPHLILRSPTLTSIVHVAPARHPALRPWGEGLRCRGQGDWPDMAGDPHGLLQLQQGDVRPILNHVVVGVGDDPADGQQPVLVVQVLLPQLHP